MGASTKIPTVAALVMKRVAAKYADLGLAREANSLEKEALSALKNGQSALSNPRKIRTSTTPALDPKSLKDRARLPSPSELDGWPGLDEANERLLAEKRAKERMQEKYPTAAALVMARMLKRIAVKYADLGLAAEGEIPGKGGALGFEEWAIRAQRSATDELRGQRTHSTGPRPKVLGGSGAIAESLRARLDLRGHPAQGHGKAPGGEARQGEGREGGLIAKAFPPEPRRRCPLAQ